MMKLYERRKRVPELPEVETVVRDLRPLLVGRSFTRIEVGKKPLRRRWSRSWEKQLLSQRVEAVGRRGKWIVIDIADACLLVHLGMTGQFTVVCDEPRATHTHLVFTLDNQSELRFRDVRRFGSVSLFSSRDALDAFFMDSRLGPEPFDIDPAYWLSALSATKRCLKAVLLDQTVVAGVGNIYADESLFEAKLHPAIPAHRVTRKHATSLRSAVALVLQRAIDRRGSSIRDYVGGDGQSGRFQHEFRVYSRTGEPCSRCRTAIRKITLAGRSTHFCPKCQKNRV
jgi:formamidopyrimidine-DNA glycosylase